MKYIFLLVLLINWTGNIAFSQTDSLELKIYSTYQPEDSAKKYNIKIDFISKKHIPVTFYLEPLRPVKCCFDFQEEVGIEIQKIDSNCFRTIQKCDECDFFRAQYNESDKKTLQYGKILSYTADISLFDKSVTKNKVVVFTGTYRCRAYRYYDETGNRRKIYSNWLYITFERQ